MENKNNTISNLQNKNLIYTKKIKESSIEIESFFHTTNDKINQILESNYYLEVNNNNRVNQTNLSNDLVTLINQIWEHSTLVEDVYQEEIRKNNKQILKLQQGDY